LITSTTTSPFTKATPGSLISLQRISPSQAVPSTAFLSALIVSHNYFVVYEEVALVFQEDGNALYALT